MKQNLEMFRIAFKREYDVITCLSPHEALEHITKKSDVPLVIADYKMPDMKGTELVNEVNRIAPDTVCMILSGHIDENTIVESKKKCDIYKYIMKPWDRDGLRINIQEAIDKFIKKRNNKSNGNGSGGFFTEQMVWLFSWFCFRRQAYFTPLCRYR